MNLTDPTRSVVPTLDGAVLAVLATAGRPMSVGQVASASARGSQIGVRRCLERLVDQGIVRATLMGRNVVHELNREHLAADIAVSLADLRNELWRRLRTELAEWHLQPAYAAVFGSAARGDGDEQSDIDILLVHNVLDGERAQEWQTQIDTLRERVEAWTGNPLQTVDICVSDWLDRPQAVAGLLSEVDRDGIAIAGNTPDQPRRG